MGEITTRAEFQHGVREAIGLAGSEGWPAMAFIDSDFAEWPLNEPGVIESLRRWALPHRRLTLVALDYEEVHRRHPRFVEWRRLWAHVIDARSPDEDAQLKELPTLLLGSAEQPLSVIVTDRVHWRGRVSRDTSDRHFYNERLDALLQRSAASFAPTMLGL